MPVTRIYVEKKMGFDVEAQRLCAELRDMPGVSGLRNLRIFRRYDVENLPSEAIETARHTIFSEPSLEKLYEENLPPLPDAVIAVAFKPGHYDQHADGTAQCLQLLTQDQRPAVACAKVYVFEGDITEEQLDQIRRVLIDPVTSFEAAADKPDTLAQAPCPAEPEPVITGFAEISRRKLVSFCKTWDLLMSVEDLARCQAYFRDQEQRDPTLAELRVIDACWSARDISREINQCAIVVDAQVDGAREPWLVALKAAPNLGEAIHDALRVGTYAYQAMRISGRGDPREAVAAAQQFAGYCNQIGLAVGKVQEVYHPDFTNQPFEMGAVIAAAPMSNFCQTVPEPGDVVLQIGGADSSYTARNLQRLFRNPDFVRRIKGCGDVTKLAPGLRIDLDSVTESPENLACLTSPQDVAQIMRLTSQENLVCALIAEVTKEPRLRMRRRGQEIVHIASEFLDCHTDNRHAKARINPLDASDPYPLRLPAVLLSDVLPKESWLRLLGDPNVGNQRGLVERFDSGAGGGTVIAPFGGTFRGTPNEAMAALLPAPGATTTMTLLAYGYDPGLCAWSPYHGGVYAVLEAIAKIVAAGGDASACRLALQASAPYAGKEGALDAQRAMELPAMDCHHTVNEPGAPPVVIAYAMAVEDVVRVITPEFKGPSHTLAYFAMPRDTNLLPDYPALRAAYDAIHVAMRKRQVLSAHTVGHGGLAAALTRMALGNRIGCSISSDLNQTDLFLPGWGGLVLELTDAIPGLTVIGHTTEEPVIHHRKMFLSLADILAAWEAPTSGALPTQASSLAAASPPQQTSFYAQRGQEKARFRTARPRVCIPCFPGTNSELDCARAFERAGASTDLIVFRNTSPQAITDSVRALAQAIGRAQIVMLPGGFTHGSGKFIATALRASQIADAINDLLNNRDGLMLGICNGFQALIKLGLLPGGSMIVPGENDAALTHNTSGRHVSIHAHTVVTSVKSPWMAGVEPGQVFAVGMSHGEGRFVCGEAQLKELYAAGQIVTQYCEPDGTPTMRTPHNPNGSAWAVEGICSPDGRILGKMGHSERVGPGVAVNIPGEKDQRLFVSGVGYFA
ncbi:MAG: phosphoribosylformylglycinamidine synthase subunit PurQ [Clostridia bacterium]|nr:phosphoribosylformylglycinamidine synthase subunit PurQ [Clostridia bacterium]